MMYADVILPVPLPGTFTYAVPEGMDVRVGECVLVAFGRSKTYLGIVVRVHQEKPVGYEVKPLLQAQQQMLADKRYASLQVFYDVDPL